jgi:hypothetical protein
MILLCFFTGLVEKGPTSRSEGIETVYKTTNDFELVFAVPGKFKVENSDTLLNK